MRFCPLYSGSSGNAIFVEAGGTALLIDAGLAGSTVADALAAVGAAAGELAGILVTHEHSDHIKGVGVLARRYGLPIYANEGTWRGMLPLIGNIPPAQMRVFETERDFYVGAMNILPFKTPHDANESVGFALRGGGVKAAVLTDAGHVSERMLDAVCESDLILIESNHDVEMLKAGAYPYPLKQRILSEHGHLSNDDCGTVLCKLYRRGVRRAILGHLSRDNNFESLAFETVRGKLRENDIPDEAFALAVAHRDRLSGMYELEP